MSLNKNKSLFKDINFAKDRNNTQPHKMSLDSLGQIHIRTSSSHKDDSIAEATKAQAHSQEGYKDFKSSTHPFGINYEEDLPSYTPSQSLIEKMPTLISHRDREHGSEPYDHLELGFEPFDHSEQITVLHFELLCIRNTILNIVYWIVFCINRIIDVVEKTANAVFSIRMMVAITLTLLVYLIFANAAMFIHAIKGNFACPCCSCSFNYCLSRSLIASLRKYGLENSYLKIHSHNHLALPVRDFFKVLPYLLLLSLTNKGF